MGWLLRIMLQWFIAFFIIFTGIMIMPQIPENAPYLFKFIYALSIVISSGYFIGLGICFEKGGYKI